MRKRTLSAVLLAAALPFSLAGVASAGDGQFLLAPTSGPAGTVVSATNADDDCAVPEGATDPFALFIVVDEATGETVVAEGDADLTGPGAFAITATVEAGTPAGAYDAVVACFADLDALEAGDPYFEFPARTFTVTAAVVAPVTPPVTQPSPSTAPRPAAPAAAPAPAKAPAKAKPAAAVKAQPRFAG